MPKGTSLAETTSNSKGIKPVALAVVKLYLSEGISQSLTQSVEISLNNIFDKILYFLKSFQVDLKARLADFR